MNFYNWPHYSKEEIKAVQKIIMSGKVNYWFGNKCKEFEFKFKRYFRRKYAISVSSGSVALDIAIGSLKLNTNDEVIVTPRSYISSASCVLNNNLKPVFADIDETSQNLTCKTIEDKISKKTKAIVIVHLAGHPCDMDPIIKLCIKKKIKIIEDCSQAHGAMYKNKYVGSFGDIAVWSFCYDKIISTLGEGGMIVTNKEKYYQRMWASRDCGKNIKKVDFQSNSIHRFRWLHDFNGSNYRLTEAQAAVGILQLKKLKYWIKKRNFFCKKILKINNKYPFLKKIKFDKNILHSFYRLYLFINKKKIKNKFKRESLVKFLNKNGIKCNFGSCPEIYLEKNFKKIFKIKRRLKNAKLLGETSIALFIGNSLGKNKETKYLKILEQILEKFNKK